jgi:hypothetical protein
VAFLLSAWPARDGAEEAPVSRSSVRELAQGLNFPQSSPRPGTTGDTCAQASAYGMGMRVAVDCAAGAMYEAGDLGQDRALLAVNFLLDRSAENWAREFARLKGEAGACRTDAAIAATGALSGDFTWTCAQGTITGVLLLAPTDPPTIQALRLSVAPRR